MSYRFVKPVLKSHNRLTKDIEYSWMLVLDSIESVFDFMEKVQYGIIKNGLLKLMYKKRAFHCTDHWEQAVEITAYCKRTSILEESVSLEERILKSRLDSVMKYGKMYINCNGAGFPHNKNIEIVDEVIKDELVWPEYSAKDIKVIKWSNGNHYYSKVGNVDMIDDKGNQKWNTYKEARTVAENFLKKT